MKLEELLATMKSLRDCTPEELQKTIDRYAANEATGKTESGETFLHQGSSKSVLVGPSEIKEPELRSLCDQRAIPWDDRYTGRVKRYIASSDDVDSYGDIIKQDGWDFTRYEVNPALLWCHNYSNPNIGAGIKWEVVGTELIIDNLFALKETFDFADVAYQLVNAGFLKGNSVGFIAKKILYVEDEEERKTLGLGRWGVVFLEQVLLEDSACPIGANPAAVVQNAFAKGVQKGIVGRDILEKLRKDESVETGAPENVREMIDKALVQLDGVKAVVPAPVVQVDVTLLTIKESIERIGLTIDEAAKSLAELSGVSKRIEDLNTKTIGIENSIALLIGDDGDTPDSGGQSAQTPETKGLFDNVLSIANSVSDKLTQTKKGANQ